MRAEFTKKAKVASLPERRFRVYEMPQGFEYTNQDVADTGVPSLCTAPLMPFAEAAWLAVQHFPGISEFFVLQHVDTRTFFSSEALLLRCSEYLAAIQVHRI